MPDTLLAQLQSALDGAYSIERELGGGGMSRVFVAEEIKLRRKVVVKVLPPDIAGTISVERFTREIQVAARLQHPHIVPLLSAGDADGVPYYTMPLIQGESLRARLSRDAQLSPSEAVRVALEVADALGYAHSQGVVHRDIKPENILLSGGHALVVDFGIAKALDASKTRADEAITHIGLSIGTPAYMSPEQAAGESNIDERSDVYSLGAVLYEMLSGKQPFTGATAAAILVARFRDTPTALRTMNGAISVSVEQAVERAMMPSPDDRYRTAGDFLAALRTSERDEARLTPASGSISAAVPAEQSIAVLPFANMSADADSEYFSDGMTEEIINALVHLPGLRVAARTSSFAFKGKHIDIGEIGKALKVTTILEGSVRRAGKKLRITAQLINVSDGFHLWSERYDREMEDVFEIQDEIARAIAEQLKIRLVGSAAQESNMRPATQNLEAYDLYLKGRYFWEKRGTHLRTAMEYFTRAAAADPSYALPYAGLADGESALTLYGYIDSAESHPRIRANAYRALELDDTIAESHAAVGLYESWFGWNSLAAERAFKRAIEIKPSWATPQAYYALALAAMGRDDEARAMAERACKTEPLSPLIHAVSSITCSNVGEPLSAMRIAERAIELDPNFGASHWAASWAHTAAGRFDDAVREMKRAVELLPGSTYVAGLLAVTYVLAGREADARALEATLGDGATAVAQRGIVRWLLGDVNHALELLDRGLQGRTAYLQNLGRLPGLGSVAASPRWHALLRKHGAEDAARMYESRSWPS